jgi:hypothetical protein
MWSAGKVSSLSVKAGFLMIFAKIALGRRLAGSVPTVPGFLPGYSAVGGRIAPEPPGCMRFVSSHPKPTPQRK